MCACIKKCNVVRSNVLGCFRTGVYCTNKSNVSGHLVMYVKLKRSLASSDVIEIETQYIKVLSDVLKDLFKKE